LRFFNLRFLDLRLFLWRLLHKLFRKSLRKSLWKLLWEFRWKFLFWWLSLGFGTSRIAIHLDGCGGSDVSVSLDRLGNSLRRFFDRRW
jgi:hypothetical protein